MKKLLILATTMLLASCGTSSPQTTTSHPTDLSSQSEESQTASVVSYKETTDAEEIESGMYIRVKYVYDINKADKKITCYDFGMDYNKLKNNEGTKVFEVSLNFVKYRTGGNAIHFNVENKDRYIYIAATGKLAEDTVNKVGDFASTETVGISPLPTLVEPTYGSYVSAEKFNQYKVDAEGKRIPDDSDGYVREEFYLFLELSKTSAKIFVGDDNQTHRETPLHQIENYSLQYNAGGVSIKIPHEGGEFNCSLTVTAKDTIKFNNAYEKYGDYSAAGTFKPIEN